MDKLINMQKNIKFKTQAQVDEYSKQNNKVLMIFDDYVLDATTFAQHHPGGSGLILNYRNKNVTKEMNLHFPLSLIMANTMVIGTFEKDISRMMNPDKAILSQIWQMDHSNYLKVVDSPHWLFVNSPRMFQTDFFQMLSHNKWYNIFAVPIAILLNYAIKIDWTGVNFISMIPFLLLGILFFSLIQYILHRFLFHSEKYLFDIKIMRYMHFILHGIHHMLPVDPDRIVFPPALAAIFLYIGYFVVWMPMHFSNQHWDFAYWTGFLIGYWIYDLIHYSLHHIDTSKSKGNYFHRLQQYHNQHHFGGEQLGFGVSSKLWDIIFRTQLIKKKIH